MPRAVTHRQQVIFRWGLRITAVAVALFVVALVPFSLVQSARVENLRVAITATRSAAAAQSARDAATVRALQAQYEELFTACQKSPACLATAPAPAPVIVRGDPGSRGAVGAAGRGIESVTCTTSGRWLIEYDDGSQETAGGVCLGRDGVNGAQGSPGADGAPSTVPGPQGPPGPSGPAGANGQDGRGIQSATCGDDSRWVITYTDGTTSDGGVCRTGLLG